MRRLAAAFIASLVLASGGALAAQGDRTIDDARSERDTVRAEKAEAAEALDAAKAEDAELAQAIQDITDSINAQQLEVEEAQRQIDVAQVVAQQAQEEVDAAEAERLQIESELGDLAVAGFLSATNSEQSVFFASGDPTEATRQASMLRLANTDAGDLLEQLRGVIEDSEISQSIAQNALDQATLLEIEMQSVLTDLEGQRVVQAELKAELETRVLDWENQLAEIRREEDELSQFIREEEARLAPPPPPAPSANPGVSAAGFQWPLNARVTSEYGYRIHPIYGSRRLHAGIDMGAATGSPIEAAKGGTVISAGSRGGYGNTVVISHGGGISTLYAHQSEIAVSAGDQVGRGEVIGYVGSTGNSTGPHLHFEIRVNGDATNPRPYLP